MQLWQVNQHEHLFASRKQEGELDGLLGMRAADCGETFIYSVQEEAQSPEEAQSLQELYGGVCVCTDVCVCVAYFNCRYEYCSLYILRP